MLNLSWTDQVRPVANAAEAGHMDLALRLAEKRLEEGISLSAIPLLAMTATFAAQGLRDWTALERWARLGLEAEPGQNHLLTLLARALMNIGKMEEAGEIAEEVIRSSPNNHHVMHTLANGFLDARNLEPALKLAKEAHRIDHRCPGCPDTRAEILLRLGRYEEAEPWARLSLEMYIEHPLHHLNLTRALILAGKVTEALETVNAVPDMAAKNKGLALWFDLLNAPDTRDKLESITPVDRDTFPHHPGLAMQCKGLGIIPIPIRFMEDLDREGSRLCVHLEESGQLRTFKANSEQPPLFTEFLLGRVALTCEQSKCSGDGEIQ